MNNDFTHSGFAGMSIIEKLERQLDMAMVFNESDIRASQIIFNDGFAYGVATCLAGMRYPSTVENEMHLSRIRLENEPEQIVERLENGVR